MCVWRDSVFWASCHPCLAPLSPRKRPPHQHKPASTPTQTTSQRLQITKTNRLTFPALHIAEIRPWIVYRLSQPCLRISCFSHGCSFAWYDPPARYVAKFFSKYECSFCAAGDSKITYRLPYKGMVVCVSGGCLLSSPPLFFYGSVLYRSSPVHSTVQSEALQSPIARSAQRCPRLGAALNCVPG